MQTLPPRGPIHKRHGANLPHWTADHATYFVTFRLADSLPQSVLLEYQRERDAVLRSLQQQPAPATGVPPVSDRQPGQFQTEQARLQRLFSEKIESYLDAGAGKCWMQNPEVAEIVQNALLFFHNGRYTLHAWAIMPNHVHAVLRPHPPHELSDILHSWKSFAAKAANKRLLRSGEFWQSEPYDHLIRDQADLAHCIEYTLDNPIRAGLVDWRWYGSTYGTR
jgi:REP element-mobilizing transposase RayT